jgi:hypothetical protein
LFSAKALLIWEDFYVSSRSIFKSLRSKAIIFYDICAETKMHGYVGILKTLSAIDITYPCTQAAFSLAKRIDRRYLFPLMFGGVPKCLFCTLQLAVLRGRCFG